jgi:hypothetical protein
MEDMKLVNISDTKEGISKSKIDYLKHTGRTRTLLIDIKE